VSAVGAGTWGNRIGVVIKDASGRKKDQTVDDVFKLVVYYWHDAPPSPLTDPADPTKFRVPPAEQEEFDDLSWDADSPTYYLRIIHGASHLIDVVDADAAAA